GSGFENRIAALVAGELDATLTYAWLPQRRGFVRKTLNAQLCDVIIGVPEHFELVRTTDPYYRSVFVFASRTDDNAEYRTFDDAVLIKARIGVQLVGDDLAATPPGHALALRGLVNNVVGYVVYGDRPQAERMIDAVANEELDVAVMWGPQAAYFARRQRVPIKLTPAHAPADLFGMPFEYSIAMGVRKADVILQQDLNAVIARRRPDIDAILREYGVPRADATFARNAEVTQ
ncbi:MAG TPA: quinoprotein dehydrogenase-associated putative ABC transporter substrate-binding protein, partial [Burkholderiales bacterium]|nr:quinoprotein dehydrogenase-associated putative ABC transporter substrate-binding protein [Burkholderiales bacterium]